MAKGDLKYYSGVLLKGSVAMSLAHAATGLVTIILLPVFTNYLTPEDYGTVALVMVVVSFLSLVYNPGMVSATQRLYYDTDDMERRQELFGSAHRFFLFVPIIFILIGLAFGPFIFEHIFSNFSFYPYGFLALILAFFSQPKRIWVNLMTVRYKVPITAIVSVISVVLGLAMALLLVVGFKMGAMGKVLAMFPTVLLYFILSFVAIHRFSRGRWSLRSIKEQLKFGAPLIPAIWSYEILHVAARYILERMATIASVGIYTFAYHLAEIPKFMVLGINQLWGPVFYDNMNKGNYSIISRLMFYLLLMLSLINILLIFFSKELIYLFINERYFTAIPIVPILVLGIFFNGLLTLTNAVLGYKNKFGTTSVIATIATVLNIGMNILLIPYYGVTGSAVAILLSYFTYFSIGLYIERKMILSIISLKVFLIPILFVISSFILFYVLNAQHVSWVEIIIKILFILTFLVVLFITGMIRKNELSYIKNSLKEGMRRKLKVNKTSD